MDLGRGALVESQGVWPECERHARTQTPGTAGPLVGTVAGDGQQRQMSAALPVAGTAHKSTVDHDADSGNGEGGLGDIRCQDDPPSGAG